MEQLADDNPPVFFDPSLTDWCNAAVAPAGQLKLARHPVGPRPVAAMDDRPGRAADASRGTWPRPRRRRASGWSPCQGSRSWSSEIRRAWGRSGATSAIIRWADRQVSRGRFGSIARTAAAKRWRRSGSSSSMRIKGDSDGPRGGRISAAAHLRPLGRGRHGRPAGLLPGAKALRQVGKVWLRGVVDDARPGSAAFSGFASSRTRAIALAMSSSLRSGRWLGGLRFEMAGDSWGKGLIPVWRGRGPAATPVGVGARFNPRDRAGR